jgi:hypothetical protein
MKYIIDFKDTILQHEIDQHILSTADTHNIRIVRHYAGLGNVFLVEADIKPDISDLIESVIEDENNALKLLGIDLVLTDSIETTTFNIEDTKNKNYKLTQIAQIKQIPTIMYISNDGSLKYYKYDISIENLKYFINMNL